MRSILRFAFVVVPTAVLAAAVVVAVSLNGQRATATVDGDLQRDLKLASTTIELAPAGQAVATVSLLETSSASAPEVAPRPNRSRSGSRVARSRAPVVRATPEPEVAEAVDEAQVAESAPHVTVEAAAEEPAERGGVALPRPTAIPISYPAPESGAVEGDSRPAGGILGGIFGTVIRGGGVDGDHCQIHNRGGGYGRPRSRGVSLSDRVHGATRQSSGEARPSYSGRRVREATRSRTEGTYSRGSSLGGRVRAATRR